MVLNVRNAFLQLLVFLLRLLKLLPNLNTFLPLFLQLLLELIDDLLLFLQHLVVLLSVFDRVLVLQLLNPCLVLDQLALEPLDGLLQAARVIGRLVLLGGGEPRRAEDERLGQLGGHRDLYVVRRVLSLRKDDFLDVRREDLGQHLNYILVFNDLVLKQLQL